jgi:transcriptional regulator with XRE-family HTH domain
MEDKLKEIGNVVKNLRKQTGLSAENFANEKGFDRVQYSRVEKGVNITMKTFLRICKSLEIKPSKFFDLTEK